MEEKIKVLVISDHPMSPSGVGIQTRYMIEGLLKSGKFKFVCLGGAVKHQDYSPVKTKEWEDDWVIFPTDGYGNADMVRSLLRTERPDMVWFMTDPRFYEWLWMVENEIRQHVPMVYYHVWDNFPYPTFNKKFYDSNDVIVAISKVTHEAVKNVAPDVELHYLPHAVDDKIFHNIEREDKHTFRKQTLKEEERELNPERMLFFWNNRNAKRKQSGTLIWWFKEFMDKVGKDNVGLLMHTDPKDSHGQDLELILEELGLVNGEVVLSSRKLPPEHISLMYNMADCTINISDAEGFGLATLESLSCETPIIVNMTGGLQEQVTDGENWFGIGIEPKSKAIIGSQQVPFIFEDRMNKEDFIGALEKMYDLWKNKPDEYQEMCKLGKQHVEKNYNFEKYQEQWVDIMTKVHEKYGSWENRKHYKTWDLAEL